ncbi:oxysterol-binding protein-related protein 3-like isoform X1 [Sinocyclocheilus anshuiensis]|uniref:Oxysterol-binding protein n=1 Tax=Sinocyclocheilus anshuiensis TaxID=1608454 RepID=A0A671M9T7_9TELE|nr:PREDICTED: oxysterol-binding protein-related protein 3-like isoform X1 [Sinocyclocheilus anshuiensis]XP_016341462.1 PREDICTED: oxysterol-binding protein-related protein 3-like isoform X1 [Sinocyclocheilus anshuiensis]XP_016341463.1 PREDICTED: oxysterol-binding protein-related protein 3-like isoform X1 [Sinocyclocheilus anshuiensis]
MSTEDQVAPLSPKTSPATPTITPFTQRKESNSSSEDNRQDSWELVEDLQGLTGNIQKPEKQEGLLLKKRKWPMKGWHKRYFLLERGILTYAKTGTDLKKGRLRGRIDVGLSVMAMKKKSMCIDLDTEDSIYHLKAKTRDLFEEWVTQLRHHRTFRQNEITMEPPERPLQSDPTANRRRSFLSKLPSALLKNSWWQNSQDMEKCCKDLSECESALLELNLLLKNMEVLHRTFSAPAINLLQTEGSKKEKRGHKKWRSKNYSKENKNTQQSNPDASSSHLHVSHPNLIYSEPVSPDSCLDSPDSPTEASRMQEEFCRLAGTVHSTLRSAYTSLCTERDRVRNTLDCISEKEVLVGSRPLRQQVSSESRGSIPESLSEFFDAKEYLLSGSSSENEASDDDSYVSDVSDNTSVEFCRNENGVAKEILSNGNNCAVTRRDRLPSTRMNESVNLWSILCSNIGKDLSKVAMPVQLNEPLNTLQRLCEEVEYCHLLDTAANTHDPHMRMVYIAAFAVSAYACSFTRAGGKPFNPILGETYECLRPDKGFHFIAEQVSHHPPVSACHCESKTYTFWQDVRWKNKFWGKSMEIVPMGVTHLELPGFADRYEWSKVTSCIHNILSGQRWIEHYGEISVKHSTTMGDVSLCKVTFLKSRSGGLNANEVEGMVTDSNGCVIHSLFGKWNEALYLGKPPSATCIWRATPFLSLYCVHIDPMPEDHEQYYGFTQFAIELNELEEGLKPLLPLTDTRFRPDQRLLEEGDIAGAEEQKERIEVLQRERRRVLQENNITHSPRFFKRAEDDSWVSNGTYWDLRKDPGFSKLEFPVLW